MITRGRIRSIWWAWWALSLLVGAASGQSAAVPSSAIRSVLGPGDLVPGFGRIGTYGFSLLGMDERGRVLLRREGGESEGLLWADGEGLADAIDRARAAELGLLTYEVGWSPNGSFALRGTAATPSAPSGDTLYALRGDAVEQIATVGERDADGFTFCDLRQPQINDAGDVAFRSVVALPGWGCEPPGEEEEPHTEPVIYLRSAAGLSRVAGSGEAVPSERRFAWVDLEIVALTDDARIVLRNGSVVARDRVELLLAADAQGPSGALLAERLLLAANRAGDAVLAATEDGARGLYRTAGGTVTRVFSQGEPAPWGGRYDQYHAQPQWLAFNDAGDVLMDGRSVAVLYPAGGVPRLLPGYPLGGGQLNNRGDAAVTMLTAAAGTLEIFRWRGDERTRMVGTGDLLPDGGYLVANGVSAGCIGPDGSIAVGAEASNGAQGLLCADVDGVHAVARVGDGAPDGRRFYSFGGCAIGRPGEIVFGGSRLLPSREPPGFYVFYDIETAIYRAGADRLERVVGPGDLATDGAVVTAVDTYHPFDADAAGRVLALPMFDGPYGLGALAVRETDGDLERLPFDVPGGYGSGSIGFPPGFPLDPQYLAGLTDTPRIPLALPADAMTFDTGGDRPRFQVIDARFADAAVVILAAPLVRSDWPDWGEWVEGPRAVLRWSDAGLQQLFGTTDQPFATDAVQRFDAIATGGDLIAVQAITATARFERVYVYRLGEGEPVEAFGSGDPTPDGPLAWFSLLGVTADGRVYFEAPAGADIGIFAWRDGAIEPVADYPLNTASPVAMNAAGTVVLEQYPPKIAVLGAGPTTASCPAPPTIVLPTATVTATPLPTATPRPSWLPDTCGTGVCVSIGFAEGQPGDHVSIAVALVTGGEDVAGTQNDLVVPPELSVVSCAAHPSSGKEVFSSTYRDSTRLLVLSLADTDAIPDGALLYTCDVQIAADALAGRHRIRCVNAGASDPSGKALRVACEDGVVTVEAPSTPTAPPAEITTPQAGSGGLRDGSSASADGCGVDGRAGRHSACAGLLVVPALLLLRRRAAH